MNMQKLVVAIITMALSAGVGWADRYVAANGRHQNGYSNWTDAATNIQAAITAATAGETVWLSNGTFSVTGQILVTNAVRVKGFFGREATVLVGGYPTLTNRCFTINHAAAWLDSLTISNFFPNDHGGGVRLVRGNIANCHFTHNQAGGGKHGAGVYIDGAWFGLITNCTFSYGSNASFGGGISMSGSAGAIRNCEFYRNYGGNGGAIFFNSYTTVVENCIMRDNSAVNGGVASASVGCPGIFRNCLMMRNVARSGGACYRGSNTYELINCTIVGNFASGAGGGIYFDYDTTPGVQEKIVNCIVYSNLAGVGGGGSHSEYLLLSPEAQTNWFFYSCVNQADSYNNRLPASHGNIAHNPQFVNADPGNPNYRLTENSPCVNTGTNQAGRMGAQDLDGRQRMDLWSLRVDMGAYEYQSGGTTTTKAATEPAVLPEAVIPFCETPPVLDGALDDAAWKQAATFGSLYVVGKDARTDKHRVLLCRNDQWLYVAFDVELPADRLPDTYGWHQSELDRKLYQENHVALSFDPSSNGSYFYRFWVNRNNVRAESRFSKQRGWEQEWNMPWRSAALETNTAWRVELALPWVLLFKTGNPQMTHMNATIRTITPHRDPQGVVLSETIEDASWSPLAADVMEQDRFGTMRLPGDFSFKEPFMPLLTGMSVGGYVQTKAGYGYTVNVALTNASIVAGKVTLEIVDEPEPDGRTARAETRDAPSFWKRLFGRNPAADGSRDDGAHEKPAAKQVLRLAENAGASRSIPIAINTLRRRSVTVNVIAPETGEILQQAVRKLKDASESDVMSAYLDRNYYTTEKAAVAVCDVRLPPQILTGHKLEVRRADARKPLAGLALTGAAGRLEIPLEKCVSGSNPLVVTLVGADGRVVSECRLELIKRTPKPGNEWKVDRINRVFLNNGKPFFPFGIMVERPVAEYHYKTIAEVGFNSLIQWGHSQSLEDLDRGLALAAKYNLALVISPEEMYARWSTETKVKDPDKILSTNQLGELNAVLKSCRGTLLNMKGALLYSKFDTLSTSQKGKVYLEYYRNNLAALTAAVQRVVSHPALMGYFILDEPLLEVGSDVVGRAYYAQLNAQDGYHPVFVNYSSGIPTTPEAVNWSDALGTDPYWIPGIGKDEGGRGTIQFMPRIVAMTRQRADVVRSVTWTIPMLEFWSGCTKRAVNSDEQRCQTYLALIQGTKGLFYYSYPFESLEMLATIRDLAGQMKLLGPVCLQPDVEQTITYSPGKLDPLNNLFTDVQAVLKTNPAGGYVLLAANSAAYPVDVKITLSGLGNPGKIGRLFAKDEHPVSDGSFTDRFEPYGVRAYVIQMQNAECRMQNEKESTAHGLPRRPATGQVATWLPTWQSTASIQIAMTALTNQFVRETGYTREGRLDKRNRIPNPSYEEATLKGWPDYHKKVWGYRQSLESLIGGNEQNWGLSVEQPFHGKQCLMLLTTNITDQIIAYTDLLVKNDKSRDYVFSAYLRADQDNVKATLKCGANEAVFTLNREWKRFNVSLTLPPGKEYIALYVILRPDNPGDRTVWVDALQFEEGRVPTAFEP